jgi:hypothetical protein
MPEDANMIKRRTEKLFYTGAGRLSNDFGHARCCESDWDEVRRFTRSPICALARYPLDMLG